mmetsp:Transcript_50528/g.126618  ORF Transcript_50528/g.126618 Transcript_50528/m.126618 type:complete len:209 (-) Transcript_50528:411-1037(-)
MRLRLGLDEPDDVALPDAARAGLPRHPQILLHHRGLVKYFVEVLVVHLDGVVALSTPHFLPELVDDGRDGLDECGQGGGVDVVPALDHPVEDEQQHLRAVAQIRRLAPHQLPQRYLSGHQLQKCLWVLPLLLLVFLERSDGACESLAGLGLVLSPWEWLDVDVLAPPAVVLEELPVVAVEGVLLQTTEPPVAHRTRRLVGGGVVPEGD